MMSRGHGRASAERRAGPRREDGVTGRKREIGHRPAEERERVCIRILLLKLLRLRFTGRYVSSVLA